MAKSKRKVLYLVNRSDWSEVQRYIYDLANNLPAEDFESSTGEVSNLLTTWKILRQERPNIVHLNLNNSKQNKILSIVCAIKLYNLFSSAPNKIKIVYTPHYSNSGFTEWLTNKLINKIITPMRKGVQAIPFFYRDEARSKLSELSTADNKVKLNRAINRLWLVTVADLHSDQGLDRLVEIIKEIKKTYPDIISVIIGEGEGREALEAQIAEAQLSDNILLLGNISETSRYLKAFDLFLLTSKQENLPYAILEAGLAELAVMAPALGGIPELIGAGRAGILIKPEETTETAETIKWLLANGLEREILGRNLEQKVRQNFSTAQMVKETVVVYNELYV